MSGIWNRHHLSPSPSMYVHRLVPVSPMIDWSDNQQMRKLTLLLPINARGSKRVSVSQILYSEIDQQSTDDNVGRYASVVNQPTPLALNNYKAASVRNGVSMLDSEVSAVVGVSGEFGTFLASKWWSGCKCADLIWAILAIFYQVLRNLYRVLGSWGWDKSTKKIEKRQRLAFQSPSVLHPIRIIQNPW